MNNLIALSVQMLFRLVLTWLNCCVVKGDATDFDGERLFVLAFRS
jgi:hypothetical protein